MQNREPPFGCLKEGCSVFPPWPTTCKPNRVRRRRKPVTSSPRYHVARTLLSLSLSLALSVCLCRCVTFTGREWAPQCGPCKAATDGVKDELRLFKVHLRRLGVVADVVGRFVAPPSDYFSSVASSRELVREFGRGGRGEKRLLTTGVP